MIVTKGKIYDNCNYCGKLVRVNKTFFGSLHVCLSPEERAQKRYNDYLANQQLHALPQEFSGLPDISKSPVDNLVDKFNCMKQPLIDTEYNPYNFKEYSKKIKMK